MVDRPGVRVLRDPYSAKPYVLFYTTKRVGGGVQDFDAIKLAEVRHELARLSRWLMPGAAPTSRGAAPFFLRGTPSKRGKT